mgnify:CR=1 FL=1
MELLLIPLIYIGGLVVGPAAKWVMAAKAVDALMETRTFTLTDGTKVKVTASVIEDDRGREVVRTEVHNMSGRRLMTAAEEKLLVERDCMRSPAFPIDRRYQRYLVGLLDELERDIRASRSRKVR